MGQRELGPGKLGSEATRRQAERPRPRGCAGCLLSIPVGTLLLNKNLCFASVPAVGDSGRQEDAEPIAKKRALSRRGRCGPWLSQGPRHFLASVTTPILFNEHGCAPTVGEVVRPWDRERLRSVCLTHLCTAVIH